MKRVHQLATTATLRLLLIVVAGWKGNIIRVGRSYGRGVRGGGGPLLHSSLHLLRAHLVCSGSSVATVTVWVVYRSIIQHLVEVTSSMRRLDIN